MTNTRSAQPATPLRRQDVLDGNRERIPIDEQAVAAQIARDARAAQQPRVTSRYDGIPIGSNLLGPRDGGVPDRDREAHARFHRVRDSMAHPRLRFAFDWYVKAHVDGARSIAELGTALMGYRDKKIAKAFGMGFLRAMFCCAAIEYSRGPVPPAVQRHGKRPDGIHQEQDRSPLDSRRQISHL